MRAILEFLFLSVVAVVASSCNIDDVITVEPPSEEEPTSTFTVIEYTPAPGQFIGDTKTGGFTSDITTTDAALEYAQQRIEGGLFVSLGAFGGYIVVASSEPITNVEGYDFIVAGNALERSSEPGIVWVMSDENGNGKADDVWYELYGSESGNEGTIYGYEVTYYRPEGDEMSVTWSDNRGGSGEVEYLKSFHNQPSYYPAWITEDSYTLRGTRLEAQSYDTSGDGSQWVNPAFGWGYADNASAQDSNLRDNYFDISNAHDATGEPIVIENINFIMVQSAIQQQCGWIGEVSTEVSGFKIVGDE